MPFDPVPFDEASQRIMVRAVERAVVKWNQQKNEAAAANAARGLGGGAIRESERLAGDAVREAGQEMIAGLQSLLEKTLGAVPADAVDWLRQIVTARVNGLKEGLGRQLESGIGAASVDDCALDSENMHAHA